MRKAFNFTRLDRRAGNQRHFRPEQCHRLDDALSMFASVKIRQARRVDLVELISRRVTLTKRGNEFVGLCPFDKERTPSFSVAPDKGLYHCFGCGGTATGSSSSRSIAEPKTRDALKDMTLPTVAPRLRYDIRRRQ